MGVEHAYGERSRLADRHERQETMPSAYERNDTDRNQQEIRKREGERKRLIMPWYKLERTKCPL